MQPIVSVHDLSPEPSTSEERVRISVFLPVHALPSEAQQDPIRLRNLLRDADALLATSHPDVDARTMLAGAREIAEHRTPWFESDGTLILLIEEGSTRSIHVDVTVDEEVVVSDRFALRPLLMSAGRDSRFHILALDLHRFELFDGTRGTLRRMALPDSAPSTIETALGDQLTDRFTTFGSYGKGSGSTPMFHGQGSRKDETDTDAVRFFRSVDRWVSEHVSEPLGIPLILATLPEHRSEFMRVARNRMLLEESIETDPWALGSDELADRAIGLLDDDRHAAVMEELEGFGDFRSRGSASSDPAEIARAAVEGRVSRLLIDPSARLNARFDTQTGALEEDADAPDVFDAIGIEVLAKGGDVEFTRQSTIEEPSGVVAFYRY